MPSDAAPNSTNAPKERMTDRDKALSGLRSPDANERLAAARLLEEFAQAEDRAFVRECLARETNAWTRRCLRRVVGRLESETSGQEPTESGDGASSLLENDLYTTAVVEVTTVFVHEFTTLVGLLEVDASACVSDYPSTDVARRIGRIKELIEALKRLRRVSEAPMHREFDLTDLINEVAREEVTEPQRIELARDDPVVVSGDPELVRLAIRNGLRNAVEASVQDAGPDQGLVIANWGSTDRDSWVALIDDGLGLPDESDALWRLGTSLKSRHNHFGFGLAIVEQAMASMGGEASLRPRADRGAVFEIRWPARGAD
jgi:signal transduction histidine kinase